MDTAETAVHPLAAVETALHPGKEPDEAWSGRGTGLEIRHEWARPLVECRGLAHERSLSQNASLIELGLVSLLDQLRLTSMYFMNRRVRNRTHGGVGGRGRQGPLLPDLSSGRFKKKRWTYRSICFTVTVSNFALRIIK